MKTSYKKGDCILHIGANYGHEVGEYELLALLGFHIEAIPAVFAELNKKCLATVHQKAICACVSDEGGRKVEFNIATNNAESSSMLPLGRHQTAYPHIRYTKKIELETTTVDQLANSGLFPPPNHIVIDVQGAEMLVLKGAKNVLAGNSLQSLKIEVSAEPLYQGGASFREVFEYLDTLGFYLKDANFNFHGWCDAIFARRWWPDKEFVLDSKAGVNIAPNARCKQSSLSRWSRGTDEAQRSVIGPATGSYSFHTDEEINPWIQLDFESSQEIKEIVVYNRIVDGPEIASRADSLKVLLSADGKDWITAYESSSLFGGIDGYPLRIKVSGGSSKHIRFQLNDNIPKALHLDLIEVYA